MPLRECGLNLNRVSMELQPHGSAEFPCAGYSSSHTDRPEDAIPWHWHEEMELVYIARGGMNVKTPGKSFVLVQGELAAINSNTLHFAAAAPECVLHSLVFSPAFITGGGQSAIARKYIQPLISSAFSGYKFSGEDARQAAVWFSAAFDALAWLSRRPWCAPEFPICRRSQEELEALLFRAPVSLMWGLSAQRASEALAAFRTPGMAAVYRDSDGSSAEELVQKPQVPPQSLPSPQPSRTPMSFGATVGAVFLGVLAAVLVLSLF